MLENKIIFKIMCLLVFVNTNASAQDVKKRIELPKSNLPATYVGNLKGVPALCIGDSLYSIDIESEKIVGLRRQYLSSNSNFDDRIRLCKVTDYAELYWYIDQFAVIAKNQDTVALLDYPNNRFANFDYSRMDIASNDSMFFICGFGQQEEYATGLYETESDSIFLVDLRKGIIEQKVLPVKGQVVQVVFDWLYYSYWKPGMRNFEISRSKIDAYEKSYGVCPNTDGESAWFVNPSDTSFIFRREYVKDSSSKYYLHSEYYNMHSREQKCLDEFKWLKNIAFDKLFYDGETRKTYSFRIFEDYIECIELPGINP